MINNPIKCDKIKWIIKQLQYLSRTDDIKNFCQILNQITIKKYLKKRANLQNVICKPPSSAVSHLTIRVLANNQRASTASEILAVLQHSAGFFFVAAY
jgi:hypothetical protein